MLEGRRYASLPIKIVIIVIHIAMYIVNLIDFATSICNSAIHSTCTLALFIPGWTLSKSDA